MTIRVKRAYDPPEPSDGYRVLVDRVWPRGVTRDKLHLDLWAKDAAPSTGLRKWFNHDPTRWREFKQRYFRELEDEEKVTAIASLRKKARRSRVTLVYGATETQFNNAVALKAYIERRTAKQPMRRTAPGISTKSERT